MPKENYEDRLSGKTRSIIKMLTHIYIDSGYDVRQKHMFGHKSYLINGHTFMLVGEWARKEIKKEKIVLMADKGKPEPTIIVIPLDETMAESFRKAHGGLYFAPGGTRLKNWLSFTGDWLYEEEKIKPIVDQLLKVYSKLPPKSMKNPGVMI